MYLEHVIIQNFRGIKDIPLNLKPGVNLLIGDNGVGKTSILEAIVAGLGACFTDIGAAAASSIPVEDIRQEIHIVDNSPQIKYWYPVRIRCEADIEGEKYAWTRVRKDEKPNTKTTIEYEKGTPRIADYFREASNESEKPLPVLAYHSINRVSQRKRSDFGTSTKKLDDRRCGYTGCFDKALDDKFIRKWCFATERKPEPNYRYDLFKQAIQQVMQKMSDLTKSPDLRYSVEFEDFVYSENNVDMPISFLSAGYQSILWLVMDVAFRLLQLNPGIRSMEHISGVVLIDEIDMHLHPKWQWNVLNALHEVFPGVQIIATTHAPIVISSCKEAQLIKIEENQTTKNIPSAFAYTADEVLKSKQDTNNVIPELTKMVSLFDKAINSGNIEVASDIYAKMKAEYSEDNSLVRNAYVDLMLEME